MKAREVFEVRFEVGDGFPTTEFDEDMVFNGGKDGEESGTGGALMERPRQLVGQLGVHFEFAMGGVEAAERGG